MTTRTIQLPDELDQFVTTSVSSGAYPDASAMMQDALRALERDRLDDDAQMKRLLEALEEGDASGVFEGDAFESVRQEMGWTAEI